MAVHYIDLASSTVVTNATGVTGTGGTVTNDVRVAWDDASEKRDVILALTKVIKLLETNSELKAEFSQ